MEDQEKMKDLGISEHNFKVYVVHFETKLENLNQRTVEINDIDELFSCFGRISKIIIFDRYL